MKESKEELHYQSDHSAHTELDHSHAGHRLKIIEFGSGLIVSFLLIFILGAVYEGLKWYRIYLQMKETKRIQKQRLAFSPQITMNQLEESVNKRLNAPHHPNEALLSPSGLNGDQVYFFKDKELRILIAC
uniref:Uncharacterized protein n=1 Tax=Panagrolaimus davidi TaxID=227884 RepID=A0A914QIN3_9BILA